MFLGGRMKSVEEIVTHLRQTLKRVGKGVRDFAAGAVEIFFKKKTQQKTWKKLEIEFQVKKQTKFNSLRLFEMCFLTAI